MTFLGFHWGFVVLTVSGCKIFKIKNLTIKKGLHTVPGTSFFLKIMKKFAAFSSISSCMKALRWSKTVFILVGKFLCIGKNENAGIFLGSWYKRNFGKFSLSWNSGNWPGKDGGSVLGNELLLYTVNELPLGAGVQVVQQPLILLLQMITIRLLF